MAAVYGIVKHHRDRISIEFQIGQGTLAHIYLPVGDLIEKTAMPSQADIPNMHQGQNLLIPEIFMTQLRALLRAEALLNNLRFLFP